MDKAIIIDSNMASAFAKIGCLTLLKRLLTRHDVFITPRIYEELTVPLDYGYTFPLDIFSHFDVLYPSVKENETYQKLLVENRALGKGELEALSICKSRGYVFSSMDFVALKFARVVDVETLELHSILRALLKSGTHSKAEVEDIIKAIEDKDNTKIKDVDLIFE